MSPLVTETIESLPVYEAGKPVEELAREMGVERAVKLASNENPLGPSPKALEAVRQALSEVNRYPDAAAYALREKLASVHSVGMDELLHGNGSNELIVLLIRTFATNADHVVFADPSFVVYKLACMAHGTPFTAVPLRDARHDLEAMAQAVRPNTKLVFVANPNNPTGTHVGAAALREFLQTVPSEVIVVMDEAYLEYADAGDYPDSLELRDCRERLIVLRTFSTIHGLAALRVGYAVGPPKLIDYVNRLRAPFNVNRLGQIAALAALSDSDHVERSRRVNREQRERVSRGLGDLGVDVTPSQTNFVWVNVKRPGREVYAELLSRGVIVRPFGDSTFLRITIGTPDENTILLRAMGEVIG